MNNKGFTLIEVLVYLALLSIIITGCLSTAYFVLETSQKIDKAITQNEEKNFLLSILSWAMDGAVAINSPTAQQNGNTLSINKSDFDKNPLVFSFTDRTLYLGIGGDAALPLNTSDTPITDFSVLHILNQSIEGASINLTFDAQNLNLIKFLK